MAEGVSDLAEKLNRLFASVPRDPSGTRRHSNESVVAALEERGVSVSPAYIGHLRRGQKNNPSARLLAGLAAVFGVPLTYFLDDDASTTITENLELLTALDSPARGVLLRASGLSPANLRHVEAILDQLRTIEGLPPITTT
jgi:transcriptional regulator with XRE-family HTH domain